MSPAPPSAEPVLTLPDLARWSFEGTALAVLGHPIGHSVSPRMHNAALADLAAGESRFAAWSYFRFDIRPEDLPEALGLLHARGFHGVNLTVPHKVLAFDQVCAVDGDARAVGAVNTLLREGAGWRGFNTDGYGLAAAVREDFGMEFSGSVVVILGAGGAARGAAVECLRAGCAALWIANRTRANLDRLLEGLAPVSPGTSRGGFVPDRPPAGLGPGSIVINATGAGLLESDPSPVDLACLPRPAAVYDMIYNPPATRLLAQARELGLPCAGGLSMLVHQGAKALEIWSGVPAARTAPIMRSAAVAAMSGS